MRYAPGEDGGNAIGGIEYRFDAAKPSIFSMKNEPERAEVWGLLLRTSRSVGMLESQDSHCNLQLTFWRKAGAWVAVSQHFSPARKLCRRFGQRDEGVPRRPGGPPYLSCWQGN